MTNRAVLSTCCGGPGCGLRPASLFCRCQTCGGSRRGTGCAICCGREAGSGLRRATGNSDGDLGAMRTGGGEAEEWMLTLYEDGLDVLWPDFSAAAVFQELAVLAVGGERGGSHDSRDHTRRQFKTTQDPRSPRFGRWEPAIWSSSVDSASQIVHSWPPSTGSPTPSRSTPIATVPTLTYSPPSRISPTSAQSPSCTVSPPPPTHRPTDLPSSL